MSNLFQCRDKKCWHSELCEYGSSPSKCPKCGGRIYAIIFDYTERTPNEDSPRWSEALGCNPEEIPEFTKLYPGSEYSPDGRLLIKNRAHKKQEMRRRGYIEL